MASLSSDRYQGFPHFITDTITAVPTSGTDLTTTDSRVWQISVCNTTAGALTFTMADKQGTPRYAIKAASIAANTTYVVAWPEGIPFSGGINWTSSGSGLEASVIGCYK